MNSAKVPQDSNNNWEQLERRKTLFRAAEVKSGVIFSFHSLILGLFVDRMDYLQSIFAQSTAFFVLSGIWMIFVILSIYYCFKCYLLFILHFKVHTVWVIPFCSFAVLKMSVKKDFQ